MKPNYEYILLKSKELTKSNARILDYGCGRGNLVKRGIDCGLNIYGVESFSFTNGEAIKKFIQDDSLIRNRVRETKIPGNKIPFPDNHFDLIVSN